MTTLNFLTFPPSYLKLFCHELHRMSFVSLQGHGNLEEISLEQREVMNDSTLFHILSPFISFLYIII